MTLIYASFSTMHIGICLNVEEIEEEKKTRVLILLLFNVCQLLRVRDKMRYVGNKNEKSEFLNKVIECLFSILT